jgi:hypothetical protein
VRGSRVSGVTVVVPGANVDAALAHVRELLAQTDRGSVLLVTSEREAIALAREINAQHVIIYTDSHGVMSADPAHVSSATPVRYISHEELMELADRGCSPIDGDAMRDASQHSISYEIRRTADDRGTIIRADGYEDRSRPITAITSASGYGLVSMGVKPSDAVPWKDLQMRVLERIASAGISLELLQSFAFGVRFLAPANRLKLMQQLAQEFGLAYQAVNGCTKLCIIGTGIRSTAGVFYHSLRALTDQNIPVLHWGDSNVTLSFVVNDHLAQRAENLLHTALAPGGGVATGGVMNFDADLGLLKIHGRETRVGKRQAQLLRYLLDNAGRIIEVEELAEHLFHAQGKDDLAAVRVHLHNLRKKIEDDPDAPRHIVTVPEQGYLFVR